MHVLLRQGEMMWAAGQVTLHLPGSVLMTDAGRCRSCLTCAPGVTHDFKS
jgi:hypothetical protein